MSDNPQPGTKAPFQEGFVVALSREDWERDYLQYLKLGLAKPGETYEDYLAALH